MISVIIPVYNAQNYVKNCIDSMLNQEYKDFELILINDGSTDSTGNILNDYKQKDDRIVVIHQNNKGVSLARNAGLNIAKGEYICFTDSDDVVPTNYLEELYSAINVDCCMSVCTTEFMKNNILQESVYMPNKTVSTKQFIKMSLIGDINPIGSFGRTSSRLIKASLLKHTFNDKFCYGEDTLFNLQYILNSKKIALTGNTKYVANEIDGSLSKSVFTKKMLSVYPMLKQTLNKIADKFELTLTEDKICIARYWTDNFIARAREIQGKSTTRNDIIKCYKYLLNVKIITVKELFAARGKSFPYILLAIVIMFKSANLLFLWFYLSKYFNKLM